MNLSIRLRIALAYAALLLLVVAAIGGFLVVRLRADLVGGIDNGLRPAAEQIASDYAKEGVPEFRDSSATVLKGERAAAQLVDPQGRVVSSFGDPIAEAPMIARRDLAAALGGNVTRTLGTRSQAFRLTVHAVEFHGERGFLVAGQSLAPVERSVGSVVTLLLIACPVALLLTAAGGWWLARRALRPVDAITSTAAAIGVDRLDERVAEPARRDELWHLANTLNTMLDRIRDGVYEQRRLVADASHELRTPLAAMRAEIDVSLRADELTPAARDVLISAREEVDRLSRMVDDLLTLASADDGGLDLRPEQADLAALAEAVVDGLRPLAADRDVRVELTGGRAPVQADPGRMERAIRNVVENAIEFSEPGGVVEVATAPGRVVVSDDGPGVPAELRERIFDRFFRVDPSRTRTTGGSGLGLAIAKEIVVAHGGSIRVEPRDRGSAFAIELPQAFNVLSEPPSYGAATI